MNTRSYLLFVAFMMCAGVVIAQSSASDQSISVIVTRCDRSAHLEWQEFPQTAWSNRNDLTLKFVAILDGNLPNNTEYHIQPLYISADGRDTLALEELVCVSRGGYKYARRRAALSGEYSLAGKTVVIKQRNCKAEVDYTDVLRLPGQTGGRVVVKQWTETCCDYESKGDITAPVISRVLPEVEEATKALLDSIRVLNAAQAVPFKVRESEEKIDLNILFPQGSSEVVINLNKNKDELLKVDELFTRMSIDGLSCALEQLTVTGYSSPEGTEQSNLSLSRNRAQSILSYLKKQYPIVARSGVEAKGAGEDWDSLRASLLESELPGKEGVIEVIDNVSNVDTREKILKELDGGKVYKQLLETYYPALRRIELRAKFLVRIVDNENAENADIESGSTK